MPRPPADESSDPMFAETADIVTFDDAEDPDLWVRPNRHPVSIEIVDHDAAWARHYAETARMIRKALARTGSFVGIEHVGSTAVPGLASKPIIDIALVVADPGVEAVYAPALGSLGFELVIRESAWYEHRMFKRLAPTSGQLLCNLHAFGPRCAEVARMRLFRDWLCDHADDRELYQSVKLSSAQESNAARESVMEYNARKQAVVREIHRRIFRAHGWV